ncbi:methylenetetrahydrofolate reductase [Thiomicrorhabdus sp. 6S2-11]|uniref:Methylenetetrahydrofolate reductase n=1 Tax=Thiomicrorhabdus marina TaxID=2818442 RepID=A0ABS3Q569_9GAMM|nr:methylenetetrahydrofolate reductase [Thiomicrorhabdus marina]MBO1927454.1 methylenetetrahydrofolate reductase [Thiomicrorhabdus marina]
MKTISSPRHKMKQPTSEFIKGFSIEITPKGALNVEHFADYLEPNTRVYVTSLPGSDFSETITTCKRLKKEGMVPVPHFTARRFKNCTDLEFALAQVSEQAGVNQVLALAGADKQAAGQFSDTISMLETGLFETYGIQSIGIAGHPEGNPDIEEANLREHGYKKIKFSEVTDIDMYMVTQFVFEAQPIIDWIENIRDEGNPLPLVIGIPGIASLKSLIGHARACGIGASKTVLIKQAKNIHKLLSLQEPNKLVQDLATYAINTPEAKINGCHLYPLGGFTRTAEWSRAIARRC